MTAATRRRFDKACFFDWLGHQDRRYELVDGVPVRLSRVTRNHNKINMNILAALFAQLDRTRFNICTGGFAVETGEKSIRFADLMVEPAGGDGQAQSTAEAVLPVEILSEESFDKNFKEKLVEYSRLPSCDTYLICDQGEPLAWQWTRSHGVWPQAPTKITGLDAVVELSVFACRLPMRDIYFGIG